MIAEIVTTITTAVTGILSGLGSGVVSLVNTLLLTSEGKLTTFAIWIIAMFAVGLGLFLFRFLFGLVRNRH